MSHTVERTFHVQKSSHGQRTIGSGQPPAPVPARLPRVTRLMALAIHFEEMLVTGQVESQAELARLGFVTRARLTQIMNLLLLAPDIQEQILHLPPVTSGRDPITERELRRIARLPSWRDQRRMIIQDSPAFVLTEPGSI